MTRMERKKEEDMLCAEIIVNRVFKKGRIEKEVYGSFAEHMGRVIYTGIYEEGHPMADENGFRLDVTKALKDMGISCVRYPGGNFVSNYHWEDGVGPKETRPRKLNIAWCSIETNQFGTNEFMKWAKQMEVEPILAINLGTRGVEEALNYLEYCNIEGGTYYSDLRKSHGEVTPHQVKYWCLGNEMDGEWQIGHKTAKEYGKLLRETAKAMKAIDSDIKVISCGSSLHTMNTFLQWEADSLEEAYEYVDYISLHQYFSGQDLGTERFLAQADAMDEYIKAVIATCDYIKAKKHSKNTINISFDEWGIWSKPSEQLVKEYQQDKWKEAPPISEMIYTFEDALLFSEMLMAILKNTDRVKIACQSLITNISSAVMTEKNGSLWLQSIYYPFAAMAKYCHGVVLNSLCQAPSFKNGDALSSYLDEVVIYNEEKSEIIIAAVNRSITEDLEVCLELQGFALKEVKEHLVLYHEDLKATNLEDHEQINLVKACNDRLEKEKVVVLLRKHSWNLVRISVES